jgi:hypothetical protein
VNNVKFIYPIVEGGKKHLKVVADAVYTAKLNKISLTWAKERERLALRTASV